MGIDDPDDEDSYLPQLTAIGYELRVREPGHSCLRGAAPDDVAVNLHCYTPGSDEVTRNLLLRNQLRSDPDDRAAYETVKRGLADQEWPT